MAFHPNRLFSIAAILLIAGVSMAKMESKEQNEEVAKGAKPCSLDDVKRPYVLIGAARLESLRKEIKAPGRAKDLFEQQIKTNADRWMGRDIAIPPPAGHYHNYTCADGTRLSEPKNQEIGTTGPYRCPACGKTYEGEKYDGGRRNLEHIWIMTACRDLALTYALTGESKYGEKAADILRKYAEAYPGRHTAVTKGGIFYQSLDESMYIIVLAQAYDLLHDSGLLSAEDIRNLEHNLFWEIAEGLTKMGAGGNWGSWHLSAVGVIGLATKHQRYIDYGVREFKRQIATELGSDGLWPESVHTYHFFPLRGFLFLAEAATNAGIDLYQWEASPTRNLREMLLRPVFYMYPDLRLPAINDGWYDSFLPAEQYEVAWYRYGLPEFAWVLQACYAGDDKGTAGAAIKDPIWALVLGKPLPKDIEMPDLPSTNFDNIGIAILRTGLRDEPGGEYVMTFDYGRQLGHGQPDKMGITLFANGRAMMADYGTPSYGSEILPFYKGTSSHNTIAIDGKNQAATKINGLVAFKDTPLVKVCVAKTVEAYPGVEWRRAVLLTDRYGLVVDDLTSADEHEYDSFLHCEGDSFRMDGVKKADSPCTFTYPYITEVECNRPTGCIAEAWWRSKDGTGLLISTLCEKDNRLFAARCPAETGTRTIPMLIVRKRGETARFVSIARPFPEIGGDQDQRAFIVPAISEGKGGELAIRLDGQTDVIRFGDTGISFQRGTGESRQSEQVSFKE